MNVYQRISTMNQVTACAGASLRLVAGLRIVVQCSATLQQSLQAQCPGASLAKLLQANLSKFAAVTSGCSCGAMETTNSIVFVDHGGPSTLCHRRTEGRVHVDSDACFKPPQVPWSSILDGHLAEFWEATATTVACVLAAGADEDVCKVFGTMPILPGDALARMYVVVSLPDLSAAAAATSKVLQRMKGCLPSEMCFSLRVTGLAPDEVRSAQGDSDFRDYCRCFQLEAEGWEDFQRAGLNLLLRGAVERKIPLLEAEVRKQRKGLRAQIRTFLGWQRVDTTQGEAAAATSIDWSLWKQLGDLQMFLGMFERAMITYRTALAECRGSGQDPAVFAIGHLVASEFLGIPVADCVSWWTASSDATSPFTDKLVVQLAVSRVLSTQALHAVRKQRYRTATDLLRAAESQLRCSGGGSPGSCQHGRAGLLTAAVLFHQFVLSWCVVLLRTAMRIRRLSEATGLLQGWLCDEVMPPPLIPDSDVLREAKLDPLCTSLLYRCGFAFLEADRQSWSEECFEAVAPWVLSCGLTSTHWSGPAWQWPMADRGYGQLKIPTAVVLRMLYTKDPTQYLLPAIMSCRDVDQPHFEDELVRKMPSKVAFMLPLVPSAAWVHKRAYRIMANNWSDFEAQLEEWGQSLNMCGLAVGTACPKMAYSCVGVPSGGTSSETLPSFESLLFAEVKEVSKLVIQAVTAIDKERQRLVQPQQRLTSTVAPKSVLQIGCAVWNPLRHQTLRCDNFGLIFESTEGAAIETDMLMFDLPPSSVRLVRVNLQLPQSGEFQLKSARCTVNRSTEVCEVVSHCTARRWFEDWDICRERRMMQGPSQICVSNRRVSYPKLRIAGSDPVLQYQLREVVVDLGIDAEAFLVVAVAEHAFRLLQPSHSEATSVWSDKVQRLAAIPFYAAAAGTHIFRCLIVQQGPSDEDNVLIGLDYIVNVLPSVSVSLTGDSSSFALIVARNNGPQMALATIGGGYSKGFRLHPGSWCATRLRWRSQPGSSSGQIPRLNLSFPASRRDGYIELRATPITY